MQTIAAVNGYGNRYMGYLVEPPLFEEPKTWARLSGQCSELGLIATM